MVLLQAAARVASKTATIPSVQPDLTVILVGVLSALVFLLLAMLVANMIKFEPGSNPRDPQKRKLWFWVLGVLATVLAFVLLYFVFSPETTPNVVNNMPKVTPAQKAAFKKAYDHYMLMAGISAGITFVLYVLLGFVLSKIFKTKKIGNWF